MNIDNMMTRVKVNNEIDLCEIVPGKNKRVADIRHRIESKLQYARVSYFIRWQEPGFFKKIFTHERARTVFCINAAQLDDALRALDELGLTESEIRMLGEKSKNQNIYTGN